MPADRQQRQCNPLTSKYTGKSAVSARPHSQQRPTPLLTLLTSADAPHHIKLAGQQIPLTVLTLPVPSEHRAGHRTKGD
ncbi:hypothetical protein [Streptomyces niveus]